MESEEFFRMYNITADEVLQKMNANETLHIIDVREKIEVNGGKIPGAIHIPLQSLMSKLDTLDKSVEYILVCRSGNRSEFARQLMAMEAFSAKNMVDGMIGWQGPVE